MVRVLNVCDNEFDLPAGEACVEPRVKTRELSSHTRLAARARYSRKRGGIAQAFNGAHRRRNKRNYL